jgi:DNA-binding response OmpR family regulator
VSDPLLLLIGPAALAMGERLRASGYTVLDWSSGAATTAAGPVDPDLALLSAGEGALIPRLRARYGAMPLLLDIGTDTVENRAASLSAGADDFWLSTSPPSELLQRLRLHLQVQARRERRPALLRLGDLSLDPSLRQVRRGGRTVDLTSREYALLHLLLRRSGQVVGRDLILSEVWSDQEAGSNVIEVYVRYLRQKLEQGGEPRLIHTLRGRGYCLSEAPPAPPPPRPEAGP